jgi:hypothetical protein
VIGARAGDGGLAGLTDDAVTAAVRAWFDTPAAEVADWAARSIYVPRVAATLGVYAVDGVARLDGGARPFRIVLKVLADDSVQAVTELAAYRAFAVRPPYGVDVPRFLGAVPLGTGVTGLWLEDVVDEAGPDWPLAAFARAGFNYGQYAGADLVGAAGARGAASRAIDFRAQQDARAAGLRRLETERGHPVLARAYPPEVVAGFGRLWAARERLLDALDDVRVAACHGDAQWRNLCARRSADGGWRTVAFDWANAGRSPLGADAAVLVHQALVYFHTDATPRDLDRAVFGGYVAGLRERPGSTCRSIWSDSPTCCTPPCGAA